jgi:hypothetical protein
MGPLFGMAGIAEAALAMIMMLGYGGLLLIGLAAAIGWLNRSRVAAAIALALAGLETFLFMPWEAFRSVSSDDTDVHHWVSEGRWFAFWWGLAVVAAVAAGIRAFAFPVQPINTPLPLNDWESGTEAKDESA